MAPRPLSVVFIAEGWQPFYNAGGETAAGGIGHHLRRQGHTITAIVHRLPREATIYQHQGITLRRRGSIRWTDRLITNAKADIIITQLSATRIGLDSGHRLGIPVAQYVHNDRTLERFRVDSGELIISNAEWVKASTPERARHIPNIVVYPPTLEVLELPDSDPRRRYLTIVNASPIKGGHIFGELAQARPRLPFLTVTGGYGKHPPPAGPNHRVVLNRPTMAPVWARTKVLLVPSEYESFGKAAGEAMAHGIPVIAHPTPGLLENLGAAGIFIDRDNRQGWLDRIDQLTRDPDAYATASAKVRARAVELSELMAHQLEELEARLLDITGRRSAA